MSDAVLSRDLAWEFLAAHKPPPPPMVPAVARGSDARDGARWQQLRGKGKCHETVGALFLVGTAAANHDALTCHHFLGDRGRSAWRQTTGGGRVGGCAQWAPSRWASGTGTKRLRRHQKEALPLVQRRSPRLLGGAPFGTDDVETCCICLDSLSSAPVTAMVVAAGGRGVGGGEGVAEESALPTRACPHFLHDGCAKQLQLMKCPLCRADFALLSRPFDCARLSERTPKELIAAVRWLAGARPRQRQLAAVEAVAPRFGADPGNELADSLVVGSAAGAVAAAPPPLVSVAPTYAVVALLVAILPVPEAAIREAISNLDAELGPGEIDEAGLGKLLQHLGVYGADMPSAKLPLDLGYTLFTRVRRRLLWLALKLSGAAGTAVLFGSVGIGIGVMSGCFRAVPKSATPVCYEMESRLMCNLKFLWMLLLMVGHGSMRPDLLFKGLVTGACSGVALGLLSGVVVVDPDRHGKHGFRSVFLAGLRGETFRAFCCCGPLRVGHRRQSQARLDVFQTASEYW